MSTYMSFFFSFFSHAVNLLNNLPVSCLDVLIDLPVQGGQEKYGGKNMDAIQKLLDFMEKRIDKVIFLFCSKFADWQDSFQTKTCQEYVCNFSY